MNIYVVNESTVLKDAEVQAALPAFRTFSNHVRAYWPRPLTLTPVLPAELPSLTWQIIILDDADQAGALGYHDFTPNGRPIAKVFAKTDLDFGYSWTVTFTHELAEMIADPWISMAMQVSDTEFYAVELGDPVEADNLGYTITTAVGDKVLCSDFVLPNWFIPGSSTNFDHKGHCTKPLQLLPGGYQSIFVSGTGWTQINDRGQRVSLDPDNPRFRKRNHE